MTTDSRKARETFWRVYDLLCKRGGLEDRFDQHPGWDKVSEKDGTSVWSRLVATVKQRGFDAAGYIFTALKAMTEDRQPPTRFHPNFLLRTSLLDDYQRKYPSLKRSIEIKWRDQLLVFDAETLQLDAMPEMAEADENARLRYVLVTQMQKFTDLFLFYKASRCGFEKLENEVRDAAKFEYSLFASVYDTLLKSKTILEKLQ